MPVHIWVGVLSKYRLTSTPNYTFGENLVLRIFQKFILTAVFAVFASQASASLIQADWFDPTEPGVGTIRCAYSQNDPINLSDPSGNSTIVSPDADNEGEYFFEEVHDGDDLGIYIRNDDFDREEWGNLGETHYWDSFKSPDTGLAVGKIYQGQSIDGYYDQKARQAATESPRTVARKSLPGNEYDLKATYSGHEDKSYHGFLLDGKYTSLREAGNMLAGHNAAKLGLSFTDLQQKAARLHGVNPVTAAWREMWGIPVGAALNWGEIDYQRTRSYYGYTKGYLQANPHQPLLP